MDGKVSIMCDSPRSKIHTLREASPKTFSPIVQLIPTGYRDIQPIQRNKCKRPRGGFEIDGGPGATNTILPVILNETSGDNHEESDEKDEETLRNIPQTSDLSPKPPPRTAIGIAKSVENGELNNRNDCLFNHLPEKSPSFDREAYHKKKQAKYNEMKVMREKIVKLEKELQEAHEQNAALSRVATTDAISTGNNTGEYISVEDKVKMERLLVQSKEFISQLIARLASTEHQSESAINTLQAKILLEQQANVALSQQMAKSNAALKNAIQRVMSLEKQLEVEKRSKENALEKLKAQNSHHVTLSDHRLKEIKSTIRTLGKEALANRVESLQSRVIEAELRSRMAEQQIQQLKKEKEYYQHTLEKTVNDSVLRYPQESEKPCNILSIRENEKGSGICLYEGTRVIDDKALLVQIYYEPPKDKSMEVTFHFIVNEPSTAQEDLLSFDVADLQRLVPDFEIYLLTFDQRMTNPIQKNRLMEIAEKLFRFLSVGYKNGHLVLTQRPYHTGTEEKAVANSKSRIRMVVYHGNVKILDGTLVEICINEAWDVVMSDVWWLELDVTSLETEQEFHLKLDQRQVLKVCKHFGSYRPSEGIMSELTKEATSIHEELFAPLFEDLVVEHGHLLLSSCVARRIDKHQEQNKESVQQFESTAPLESSQMPIGQQVGVNEKPLDYRCILLLRWSHEKEERYFFMRMVEKWDGILLLQITLDDAEEPEKYHYHYELTIKEEELIQIAELLSLTQPSLAMDPIDINEIPFGLPHNFHEPLRRFIRQTLCIADTGPKDVRIMLDWTSYHLPTHLSSMRLSSVVGLPSQIEMIDGLLWEDVERIHQNRSESRKKVYGCRVKRQYVCIKYSEIWTKDKERIVVIHAMQIGNREDQYRTLVVKAQVLAIEKVVKCWLG